MTTRIDLRAARFRVKALSTSNLTLSGTQTVDGVSCGPGSFVGALGQSDNKNAVYFIPLAGGAWVPADPGIGRGLEVYAIGGSTNGGTVYGCDTADPITWGTTSTAFTLKSSSGAAFNPASPGPIGGTTPAAVTATAVSATSVTVTGTMAVKAGGLVTPDSTETILSGTGLAGTATGLGITDGAGQALVIRPGGQTSGAVSGMDPQTCTLATNGTFDYDNESHGGYLIVGANDGSAGALVVFSTAAVTTLVVGTTNVSITLGTSSKLNIGASGGKVRFENKTAGSLSLVILPHIFSGA